MSKLWSTRQIPDSRYKKKNTQNEHIIAHFGHFFTCHYIKTVWLAENLNKIKITHYEKIFSHIKQKFSHFEKGLGNVLQRKHFFVSFLPTVKLKGQISEHSFLKGSCFKILNIAEQV